MTKRDAVLEILTAGIPARLAPAAAEKLCSAAAAALPGEGLTSDGERAYATGRRIVLYVSGLPPFACSPDGKRGQPASRVLARVFARLVEEAVPQGVRVLGLAALAGDKAITFSACGLKAGRATAGPDSRGARRVALSTAEKYFRDLERAGAVVRDDERLAVLRRELAAAAARMKLRVEEDPDLLRETLYLAETPVCVVSGYPQEFLSLPHPVLRAVMTRRLRFFPVTDAAGALQPYFIGVRDGASRGQGAVEDGFRRALESALQDARFHLGRGAAGPDEVLRRMA